MILKKLFLKWLSFKKKKKSQRGVYINNTYVAITDTRDFPCSTETPEETPRYYTIPDLPEIRSQQTIGSCASHAAIAAIEIMSQGPQRVELSELFHYYNARKYVNMQYPEDLGMTIPDACKSAHQYGSTPEVAWPYVEEKYNEEPSMAAYWLSGMWAVDRYERLNTKSQIKASLLENVPVIIGIHIDKTFYNLNQTNYIYDPQIPGNYGGHAVLIVGYDDIRELFFIRNSWGTTWGKKGYCWLTYPGFDNNSFDPWRIILKR